jgi:hypothetical protein
MLWCREVGDIRRQATIHMSGSFVECCFKSSCDPFWMPILNTGIFAKDLSRLIKDKFQFESSEIFIAHPDTLKPYKGKQWISPFEPVRIWVMPHGTKSANAWWKQKYQTNRREVNNEVVDDFETPPLVYPESDSESESESDQSSGKPSVVSSIPEHSDEDDMPFHAVRIGRKPGIYMSKAEMNKQILDYDGAEFQSFASLQDANAYLNMTDAASERSLMSTGSRARHPPMKSFSPALDAIAQSHIVLVDVVFGTIFDAQTKRGYYAGLFFPNANRSAKLTHTEVIPACNNAARCELIAATISLKQLGAIEHLDPVHTLIRFYCTSTYATNAVNEYARSATNPAGANADIMIHLARALKNGKVRAFWMASTDLLQADVQKLAVNYRMKEQKK